MLRRIDYLELNPGQGSTREEDSPPAPTIFAAGRATEGTEAAGSATTSSAPSGQEKSNANAR